MEDSIVLVTGSTDGIGKQTALELARLGATVLLHGRNAERGQKALAEVGTATGSERLDYFAADLSSLEQVRALAAQVREKYDRLHVLVNNAGVYMHERRLTEDGLETTFAVNHLAPFLLTHLLLDLLTKSAPARIVNVSSALHHSARVDLDDLQGEKRFSGFSAYCLSKFGNVLFTYELAERLAGTGVTVNALHPGGIATKLLRAASGSSGASLEEGAATPVYLASAPEVENVTGKYFVRKQPASSAALTLDLKLRREFWAISERLAGITT
jgi:NAD(P)-dependent dehydrogenase (short-subunit alcohol dehydrogenase family)